MANHSYIDMPLDMTADKAIEIALSVARERVDPGLVCRILDGERPCKGRRVVRAVLELPGTSEGPPDPVEPIGFEVWWVELYHGSSELARCYEFRHPFNRWAWWAQGALRERLAERFSGFTRGDDWGSRPARTAWPKTYFDFVWHRPERPKTEGDWAYVEREMIWAPEWHRVKEGDMGQNASASIETQWDNGGWSHECHFWTLPRHRDMYAEMQNSSWAMPEDADPMTESFFNRDAGCQPGHCSPDEMIAWVGRHCPNDPDWLAVCAAAKAYEDGGRRKVRIVWWFDQ